MHEGQRKRANEQGSPRMYIGTSGWNYKHWAEVFYPKDCPKARWLEFYAGHFSTVELNASFYRLPKPQTFENWRERTPDDFLWAVKASRYITHIKRLKESAEPLERLYGAVDVLEEKLGPILFQLPPSLSFNEEVFGRFCQHLKKDRLYVLEVRHPSWEHQKAIDMLRDHNIALCVSDTAGRYPYLEEDTATFAYIRLHGSKQLYASDYSEAELQAYAQKIMQWSKDTYLYFDNDYHGYAVKNARRMKEILGLS
ncbi:MAG: DUF72 domain-containing protein [Deltaproteobacteria bacterium]|nr:MAG: DUF72 domain-containing protein [Deltaproteobacteria bacterium]